MDLCFACVVKHGAKQVLRVRHCRGLRLNEAVPKQRIEFASDDYSHQYLSTARAFAFGGGCSRQVVGGRATREYEPTVVALSALSFLMCRTDVFYSSHNFA